MAVRIAETEEFLTWIQSVDLIAGEHDLRIILTGFARGAINTQTIINYANPGETTWQFPVRGNKLLQRKAMETTLKLLEIDSKNVLIEEKMLRPYGAFLIASQQKVELTEYLTVSIASSTLTEEKLAA